MQAQSLEIKAALQIAKSAHDIFEAVVDPSVMSMYFIAESTGRMEEGKDLVWRFPEFDMDIPVRIGKMVQDEYISYSWSGDDGKDTLVEMSLRPAPNNTTVVTVTEKSRDNDEAGIKWLKGNTEGWTSFLCCLKAWLEYGINLRKGGYDFRAQQAG